MLLKNNDIITKTLFPLNKRKAIRNNAVSFFFHEKCRL